MDSPDLGRGQGVAKGKGSEQWLMLVISLSRNISLAPLMEIAPM
jgi:hypothetical protein